MILQLALDLLLASLLVGLAWHLLRTPDLFQAGVQFIVFGLLMAVAWLRLKAPDVALAEAAIGAGVTGALFLNTLAGIGIHPADPDPDPSQGPGARLAGALAVALAGLMVVLVAGGLLGPVPAEAPLGGTGKLTNPVTAILLDVRGYDTLLETAVLVEALMGVWILGRIPAAAPEAEAPPVLVTLIRTLAPVMVVVAGAILWNGATGTGGAFQGAAILAAAGILLRLGGHRLPFLERERTRAAVAAAGTLVFLGVGIGLMTAGRAFLDYPSPWQGWLVLGIEAMVTLSIAVVLMLLFEVTSPPAREPGR